MSVFRASRYRLAPALPSLTEIQVSKFYAFLMEGITPSLHIINPIRFGSKNMRIILYPELYHLFLPTMTEEYVLEEKMTYTLGIYVPGHLFFGDIPLEEPQWINLGQIPMMTRNGHFIVNGLVRVLVHQILRRPGIYFKEKILPPGIGFRSPRMVIRENQIHEKRYIWVDFICKRGSWIRIQRDPKKRFWFCLKYRPKLTLQSVIHCMQVIENCMINGIPPLEQDQKQLISLYIRLKSLNPKTANIEGGEWKIPFKFFYNRFKRLQSYSLGSDGRNQLNLRLQLNESVLYLTSHDLLRTKEAMQDFTQYYTIPDDIDNLSNRHVRTSSDYYQLRFQSGLFMLVNTVRRRMRLLKGPVSARQLVDGSTFTQAFRGHFMTNPLSQILDQTNPLSDITHKRRIYATGPGGVTLENATIDMRSIHPTYYGRICPIETPEGKRAGLVSSLAPLGRVDGNGIIYSPYYPVAQGQIQKRAGFFYMSPSQEQGSALRMSPMDVARDFAQTLSAKVFIPARVTTEVQEEFVNIPRTEVDFVGIEPVQFLSIGISLIPFLEHDDANRALMGSGMQRQTIPPLEPARPIVATGLEGVVVGESGQALIAEHTGIVSYVSGDVIKVLSPTTVVSTLGESSRKELSMKAPSSAKTLSAKTPSLIKALLATELQSCEPPILPTFPGFISTTVFADSVFADEGVTNDLNDGFVEDNSGYRTLRGSWLSGMTQLWWSSTLSSKTQTDTMDSTLLESVSVVPQVHCYPLTNYQRSNQETSLNQRPAVHEGQWVQKGDLLADCSASVGGHLAIGQNLLVAYVPWDGYNFEDAVVISERLVFDDLYTTLHIERHEIEARRRSDGLDEMEIINRDLVPGLTVWQHHVLDPNGIIRVGSWVEPHDILVRRFFRLKGTKLGPYERLLYDILERKPPSHKETSLRVPAGVSGRVINVQILDYMPLTPLMRDAFQKCDLPVPERLPKTVRIFIAETRRIVVGDKVAGRHGNKGVVSCVAPHQDMPYLPDGRPTDMVLNPLGVPSRMNVGQVFECLLGLAGSYLQQDFRITPFDEIFGPETSRSIVFLKLYQARLKTRKSWLFQPAFPGKVPVFDGRNGHCFEQFVTVGCAYMLKLVHLVDEKIHARNTGPYTLLMEQPVKGRSKKGGQRLGEMEVWALEAYGAAYTLQEMLSLKSDDFEGRHHILQTVIQPQRDLNFIREQDKKLVEREERRRIQREERRARREAYRLQQEKKKAQKEQQKKEQEELEKQEQDSSSIDQTTMNTTITTTPKAEGDKKTKKTKKTKTTKKAMTKAKKKSTPLLPSELIIPGKADPSQFGIDVSPSQSAGIMPMDLDAAALLKFLEEAKDAEEPSVLLPEHDPRIRPSLDFSLGLSDGFRVLLRELQSLCLDVGVYALTTPLPEKGNSYNTVPFGSVYNYEDLDTEVPISSEEVFLCEPVDFVETEKRARAAKAAKEEMEERAEMEELGEIQEIRPPLIEVLEKLEQTFQDTDPLVQQIRKIRADFTDVNILSEDQYQELASLVTKDVIKWILPLLSRKYKKAFIEEIIIKLNLLKVNVQWQKLQKQVLQRHGKKKVKFHQVLKLRRNLWKKRAAWSAQLLSKEDMQNLTKHIDAAQDNYKEAIMADFANAVEREVNRRGYFTSTERPAYLDSLGDDLTKYLEEIAQKSNMPAYLVYISQSISDFFTKYLEDIANQLKKALQREQIEHRENQRQDHLSQDSPQSLKKPMVKELARLVSLAKKITKISSKKADLPKDLKVFKLRKELHSLLVKYKEDKASIEMFFTKELVNQSFRKETQMWQPSPVTLVELEKSMARRLNNPDFWKWRRFVIKTYRNDDRDDQKLQ